MLSLMRGGAVATYTVASLGLLDAQLLATRSASQGELVDRHLRRWCRGLLSVCGVHLWRAGETPAGAERARLVVANHRSPFDIPILLSVFGGQFLMCGFGMAGGGRAARRVGTIFVNREDRASGAKAIRAIRRGLMGAVIVFPEGTARRGRGARVLAAPLRRFVDSMRKRRRARLSARARMGQRGLLDRITGCARTAVDAGFCVGAPIEARWHASC